MRETKSPGEEYADWKAPETGVEVAPERAEALSAETPEQLIEAVPEQERGALRKMGEKIFGRAAIEEVATSIRAQAGLMRELGSGIKGDKITWSGIDKKRAGFYATYAIMGAVAAELGSPDSAEAAEEGAHDEELKQIMFDAMPETPDGERVPLDQYTESQRMAAGQAFELRQRFVVEGGTPALYEMQVDDMWDIQRELEGENFLNENRRADETGRWGSRILEQHGMQADFDERQIQIFDSAVGAVESIEGVSARERVLFKEAATKAIQEAGTDSGALRNKFDTLLRVTEAVQGKRFISQYSENLYLEGLYNEVLQGDASQPAQEVEKVITEERPAGEREKSADVSSATDAFEARNNANWSENLEAIPDDWSSRAGEVWTSKDGKVTFAVGKGQSRDIQMARSSAQMDARATLVRGGEGRGFVYSGEGGSPVKYERSSDGTHCLMAVPTELLK